MVPLPLVQSSNHLIPSILPPHLIAVFVGATSGIGEATLKQFAKHTVRPRVYFVGRSQDAGDRIAAECKAQNPDGEYIFIKADVSLIRVVDEVCEGIKAKEKTINVLFLSAGLPSMDRRETSERLHLLSALTFYSRLRFTTNLLPLLRPAPSLRRVITVASGTYEGPLFPHDFPALRVPLTAIRGHLATLITLSLDAVAKTAPEVGFVHDYPGTVRTALVDRMGGWQGVLMRAWVFVVGYWKGVPVEECGERHLFLATSARFKSRNGDGDGVPVGEGVEVARGTDGEVGSGVYSVGWDGASASYAVEELLAGYRDQGMVGEIWRHAESEFERITRSKQT